MPGTVRDRNRRGEGDKLREAIVAAAAALIDDASDPVTLRGIARHASIAAPSIYPHFADLQAILDVVLERSFAELDASVARAMDKEQSPADRLVAGCLAYVDYGWRNRSRYRFMIADTGFAPQAITTFVRVENTLRECIDAGLSASTDPHEDVFLLWVGMHGMATLDKPDRAQLRQLGPLDRLALAEKLAKRLARLQS